MFSFEKSILILLTKVIVLFKGTKVTLLSKYCSNFYYRCEAIECAAFQSHSDYFHIAKQNYFNLLQKSLNSVVLFIIHCCWQFLYCYITHICQNFLFSIIQFLSFEFWVLSMKMIKNIKSRRGPTMHHWRNELLTFCSQSKLRQFWLWPNFGPNCLLVFSESSPTSKKNNFWQISSFEIEPVFRQLETEKHE